MRTALQVTVTCLLSFGLFALALFWPAGTFDYWEAWLFLGIYLALSVIFTVYIGLTNPAVLRRRMNAGPRHESRPAQQVISAGIVLAFAALLVVSALDHRFGWSNVPTPVVAIGNLLVVAGLSIAMVVVNQNVYAAANITVEADQAVISTGLYGLVRHPMYFGALVMLIGVPLALGSFWALLIDGFYLVLFAARIFDEEKALAEELTGYQQYTQKVRSRLVPGVW